MARIGLQYVGLDRRHRDGPDMPLWDAGRVDLEGGLTHKRQVTIVQAAVKIVHTGPANNGAQSLRIQLDNISNCPVQSRCLLRANLGQPVLDVTHRDNETIAHCAVFVSSEVISCSQSGDVSSHSLQEGVGRLTNSCIFHSTLSWQDTPCYHWSASVQPVA